MTIRILEEPANSLDAYGEVPIAFEVSRRVRIVETEEGALQLVEEQVLPSWRKDYDRDAAPPRRWPELWDLSTWGVLAAFDGDRRVGGALVAWRTADLDMLEGRDDLAVLWDLRVDPGRRRHGIGARLVEAARTWSAARACVRLDVETQDINVPACRFYARQGFRLLRAERHAYPSCPDETKLVWTLPLA